jgi:hypothetical protein
VVAKPGEDEEEDEIDDEMKNIKRTNAYGLM